MRLNRIFAVLLALLFAFNASAQYVSQMGYRDYSAQSQMNIGSGRLKSTNPSAYLELGDSLFSRKGLLFPRGNKDSVSNPAKGLVLFDLPSSRLKIYNGVVWEDLGTSGGPATIVTNGLNMSVTGTALDAVQGKVLKDMVDLKVNNVIQRNDSLFQLKGTDETFVGKAGGGTTAFNGNRTLTAPISGITGTTPGGSTVAEFLENVFYPSQPPTATLTLTYGGTTAGNLQIERMAAGADISVSLNWSAGRQGSTATLSTITVGGNALSFTQPSAPGTVSGVVVGSVARNTNTSFSNVVVTSDGKSATASASVAFFDKRYWGFVSSSNPSDAAIQGLTNEFITQRTRAQTATQTPTGSQYFALAFPESFDPSNVSQIWYAGLNQTGAFTRTVRSFTNASGATTSYIVYVMNTPTAGSYNIEIK